MGAKMVDRDLDEEAPATQLVNTTGSGAIDLNNLPGKKRIELIKNGELNIDQLVHADNMPGKKLAELREANRARVKQEMGNEPNPYKVGDMVSYKDKIYEVMKIDEDRGVCIEKKPGKLVWVHHTVVEKG